MVGLEGRVISFLIFLLIIFLVIHVGFALSQALAALFRTVNVAIAIYMLIIVYSLLLGKLFLSFLKCIESLFKVDLLFILMTYQNM